MCRLLEWLYLLIPVRFVRAQLLRSHIEACARCRERFNLSSDLGTVSVTPDWIDAEESLWPAVRERIRRTTPAASGRRPVPLHFVRRWRWEIPVILAGILAVAGVGLFLLRPAADPNARPRVSIIRINSGGREAKTFIYQTREASYVWVSSAPKKEGE